MGDYQLHDEYDLIVLGLGPGGEAVASKLAQAGRRVLGVDARLVGGECPYYGCIPSKMIVRAAHTLAESRRVGQLAGTASDRPDFSRVAERIRDEAADDWDDQVAVDRLEGFGAHFLRGAARFAGRTAAGLPVVEVGDRRFVARDGVVVATGASPTLPPIPGLRQLAGDKLSPDGPVWTNREVLQIKQAPRSLIVIGGGPIGTELVQAFNRFGVRVTQLEAAEQILSAEEAAAAEVVADVLRREGVDLRVGVKITDISSGEDGVVVELEGGERIEAERLLVAAGRRTNLSELALGSVGLDPDSAHLYVDEHMRAGEKIFAVGDVTGVAPFTHVATWQARVLIEHLLARPESFGGYHGLAWCTFTDPEVGHVGITERQARERGIDVTTGRAEIADDSRGWIHGPGNDGFVKLVVDRSAGVLVGATVVAPSGGEILGLLSLAVHAKVPVATLATMHYVFPTLHRTVLEAVQAIG